MKKYLTKLLFLIMLFYIVPIDAYADIQKSALEKPSIINSFEEKDKNYHEKILLSKSKFTRGNKALNEMEKTTNEMTPTTTQGINRYLVKFKSDVSLEEINNLISSYTYKIIGQSSNRLFRIDIDNIEEFNELSKLIVEWIEMDSKKKLHILPNDPKISSQWAINTLSLPQAWDITKGSDSVYVAVIDSGVNRNHPDFENANLRNGWDLIFKKFVDWDSTGHGTEVTGVIAATSDNGRGIAGTSWDVSIIPIRVVYSDGTIFNSDVAEAIYLAADLESKVINLSLGGSDYSIGVNSAIQYATSKGSIVVASAGNDGDSTINYPASNDNVISVASVNKNLTHSNFSNYNSYIDVSAPGEGILTTLDNDFSDSYTYVDGTSFSAPYVSGIAALAAAYVPDITAAQFKNAIIATSTDLGTVGYDNYYGYGLINAEKLLGYLTQAISIPVTGVSLNKSSTTINVGENEILTATLAPTNATNKNVTWMSSNTEVATVDINGKVVGVSAGTAEITVTTADGSKTANCSVIVTEVSLKTSLPLITLATNPLNQDSAGLFIGLEGILDNQGNFIEGEKINGYKIELSYDADQVKVLDVLDQAQFGSFTSNIDDVSGKVYISDINIDDKSNIDKLIFVPLALTGSANTKVYFTIQFTEISDRDLTIMAPPQPIILTFQRGKILNGGTEPSITDAVAGLQYLANLREVGLESNQVNVVNMASILIPEAGAKTIQPSVKDIIALMQNLVGLRDDTFQVVSGS